MHYLFSIVFWHWIKSLIKQYLSSERVALCCLCLIKTNEEKGLKGPQRHSSYSSFSEAAEHTNSELRFCFKERKVEIFSFVWRLSSKVGWKKRLYKVRDWDYRYLFPFFSDWGKKTGGFILFFIFFCIKMGRSKLKIKTESNDNHMHHISWNCNSSHTNELWTILGESGCDIFHSCPF